MVLPNVGKEQHAYLTHIVRNYDSLANCWTVFLHGKMPTCGFFLSNPKLIGNHLLTNVSIYSTTSRRRATCSCHSQAAPTAT